MSIAKEEITELLMQVENGEPVKHNGVEGKFLIDA